MRVTRFSRLLRHYLAFSQERNREELQDTLHDITLLVHVTDICSIVEGGKGVALKHETPMVY